MSRLALCNRQNLFLLQRQRTFRLYLYRIGYLARPQMPNEAARDGLLIGFTYKIDESFVGESIGNFLKNILPHLPTEYALP